VRAQPQAPAWERMIPWALAAVLFAGLAVRIAFIDSGGFRTDVATFEGWTIALLDHGLHAFYAKAGFADYPPGYFYILALVGHIWSLFRTHDSGYTVLLVLVKLPAILADLAIGALVYAIGSRFARPAAALGAAALYVLNPATIVISAVWGQVDSVAAALALLAVYLLLKSDDREPQRIAWEIPAAWLVLSYSLLIKPQAAVLLPIFIAFAFTSPARRKVRVAGTAIGVALSALFVFALVVPFHPTANPLAAAQWLLGRYEFASSVYPDNSVNAFNLWAIRGNLWQPDAARVGVPFVPFLQLPQYVWGIVLVVAAVVLVVWRYVAERSPSALLESCMLALLAFFILATRMHERYVFDGFTFCIACVPLARRYLWGAISLSIVLFANLLYSLQYLSVVTSHPAGVNAMNLWGPWTHVLALISVGTFFVLGYLFLGTGSEESTVASVPKTPVARVAETPWWRRARGWFDPTEGLARMTKLDYAVTSALGVASFVLSFVGYWHPASHSGQCWTVKGVQHCGIFDEIYYARAAEDCLHNMRIFENTQPPVSKLLITLSTILFGGLAHGDNAHGWRFLNVVFGALAVVLLYAFAKRVTGSTLFASIASFFLLCDGMHYVQSRIATPEGFYVVFSLGAVYSFYRYWIASQTGERKHLLVPPWAYGAAAAVALAAGLAVAAVWKLLWHPLGTASFVVTTLYVGLGVYLAERFWIFPARFADGRVERTYPDGSSTLDDASPVRYETPAGSAVYSGGEIRSGAAVEDARAARFWLVIFAISLGLFISTKWNGVTGLGFSFALLTFIWLQRFFSKERLPLWGNPRGFRLDGVLLGIFFVCATVYALSWVPDLVRQSPAPYEIHNFNDVVYRQYTMFEYHDHLKATHPYSSKPWEWPLDYVPIAYFYQDHRTNRNDPNGCCVQEITSFPNPFNMWIGLVTVPIVGFLAWKEKRKAYALIVAAYLFQWLPWMLSPRIDFMYEFYVDIPLICLCNAIVLQRIWETMKDRARNGRLLGASSVGAVVLLIGLGFVYFFPILSAKPITWNAWHDRMWIEKWIVGPG
jgi:Gpi18-like mannosyltransferase